jgi:hypothetical protein
VQADRVRCARCAQTVAWWTEVNGAPHCPHCQWPAGLPYPAPQPPKKGMSTVAIVLLILAIPIALIVITIVLSATVFVLVSDIGGQQNVAPAFNLAKNEEADSLGVESAAQNADWNRLLLQSDAAIRFEVNADATEASRVAAPGIRVDITDEPHPMAVGDFLAFCGESGPLSAVTIEMIDEEANQNMGSWVFSDMAACG